MFNSLNINIDSVEFEYVTKGNLEVISVGRPDGIGYSQWSGAWEAFVEFLDSRQKALSDYVERQIDTSELEDLKDQIEELEEENRVLQRDLEAAEKANADLEDQIEDMHKQRDYGE